MRRAPYYKGGTPVLALQDADLAALQPAIGEARKAWHEDVIAAGGDKGTVVIGAGLAVPVIRPRARYAWGRVVISPPGTQGDGSWAVARAKQILQDSVPEGVVVSFEYGRMD